MHVDGVRTLDELATALRDLRSAAGGPSYAEIARRIGDHRASHRAGDPARPSRATVYDCFRLGRRRVDADLVAEIVRALGEPETRVRRWVRACGRAQDTFEPLAAVDVRGDLPTDDSPFVGRGPEIERVLAGARAGGRRVVTIEGMPGVGKTRLAVRVARHLLAEGLADRVVVADLRGYDAAEPPAEPGPVLDGLLRVVGAAPYGRSVDERRRAWRSALARARTVVVLDDASSADQVRPLLPDPDDPRDVDGSGGGDAVDAVDAVVLVTSRVALDVGTTTRIRLEPLPEPDAVALLGAVAGDAMVSADPDAARALVNEVGNLPLAVGLTGARVAGTTGWSLVDHVAAMEERLRGQRIDRAIEAALVPSYAAAAPDLRRLLRRLAVQPCPSLDAEAVAALTDTTAADAQTALDALADQHLVQRTDGRVALHALMRAFAIDRSYDEDRPADRRDAVTRLARHFLDRVWAAYRAVNGDARSPRVPVAAAPLEAVAAHDWLADNVVAATTIARHGDELALPSLVNDLAEGLDWWLIRHGRPGEAIRLAGAALSAARDAGDTVGEVRASVDLGQALLVAGDHAAADERLATAARLAEQSGAASEAMAALNARAIIHARAGDLDASAAGFDQVARHAQRLGDRLAEAKALDNLAIIRRKTGDLASAADLHARTADLARDLGDADQEARAHVNVSEVLLLLGRPEDALAAARRGVGLAEPFGLATFGYGLDNVGSALVALGRTDEALTAYGAALARSRDLDDRHLECAVLNNVGIAHLRRGEPQPAREHHEQVLAVAADHPDPFEHARALVGLGDVASHEGDSVRAHALWSEALGVFERIAAPEAAAVKERLATDDLVAHRPREDARASSRGRRGHPQDNTSTTAPDPARPASG